MPSHRPAQPVLKRAARLPRRTWHGPPPHALLFAFFAQHLCSRLGQRTGALRQCCAIGLNPLGWGCARCAAAFPWRIAMP